MQQGATTSKPNGLLCLDFDQTITHPHTHNTLHKALSQDRVRSGRTEIGPDKVHLHLTGQAVGTIAGTHLDLSPEQLQSSSTQSAIREGDMTLTTVTDEERRMIQQQVDALISRDNLKNPDQMRDLIREALTNNIKVAVTSFTKYQDIIPLALKNMGLRDDEVGQILIVGDFPLSEDRYSLSTETGGNPNSPLCKEDHLKRAMVLAGFNPDDPADRQKVVLVDDTRQNILQASGVDPTPWVTQPLRVKPTTTFGSKAVFVNLSQGALPSQYITPTYGLLGISAPQPPRQQLFSDETPIGTPLGAATPIGTVTPPRRGDETPVENPLTPETKVSSTLERAKQILQQQKLEQERQQQEKKIEREAEVKPTPPIKGGGPSTPRQ